MMMKFFVVWLTDERRLVLFPAETIARDPHRISNPPQALNLRGT